ncbi:MAG TPA: TetR family transcriptional regulator [Solirubrobacteraceae bacterium]|nr:TetR family transcriptional regulator [Solirubrobacteraceae bacterium]
MVAEPASPRVSAAVPDRSQRAQIAQVQRARIVAGAVQAVCERGAANVAIAEIVQLAGVSRRTFYELFADRDQCLLAAFEDALAVVAARVVPEALAEQRWLDQLRTGTAALMRFFDEEPRLARLLVCESLAAGRAGAEWRSGVLAQLAAFVDEAGLEGRSPERVPAMQAEASVGGMLAILQGQLANGEQSEAGSFTALTPSLVAMVVLPYLGRAVAAREMRRQAPVGEVRARSQVLPEFSFKEAGMRVTYRTMRVLLAIADRPGASNREIGDLAEIGDKGQASKLLRRLVRAGLIDNEGAVPGQGAPNAWRLTAAGQQFAQTVRSYPASTPIDEGIGQGGRAVARGASGRRVVSERRGLNNKPRRGK